MLTVVDDDALENSSAAADCRRAAAEEEKEASEDPVRKTWSRDLFTATPITESFFSSPRISPTVSGKKNSNVYHGYFKVYCFVVVVVVVICY